MTIFDISFAKTGTKSLAEAMRILGYRASHFCPLEYEQDFMRKVPYGRFDLKLIDDHDFIGNLLYPYFPILDKQFPQAKFIFLDRDESSWLNSMIHQFRRVQKNFSRDALTFCRIANIGFVENLDRDWLLFKYRQHKEAVLRHFSDRNNLLVMQISQGWWPLCSFLKARRIPDEPFPWIGASVEPQKEEKKRIKLM